jgi:mono/diheme cytochrome c family protein/glucose/arabinose dehydrogenase
MNRPLAFLFLTLAAGTTGWALHDKDAGPATVELKFRPPAPKPLTTEEALKAFKIAPGFKVELFAAEPMIECPIAMSWDEQGRMYVLEMRGYMHDVEGTGEDKPTGIVSVLEDTDGDGKADKRTVFADGLVLPRAVMCVNGGALIAEPPNLWFMKDTDGDGKADVREVVDPAYGSRGGQPEHMANSPTRLLDNWVYSANHGKRYRLKDGKWLTETVPVRGQWGMTQDDYGRQFYNFNSDFLRANLVPELFYKRNPNWPGSAGAGVQVVKDQSTWPIAPTPGVNRGYAPKTLTDDGKLMACTATCGAAIFRSDLFGKEYAGNAFIPEPSANLVKRFILREKDGMITGENVKKGEEFLASTDERFRPVNAYTGPDGALYLADMYRGVIQHKGFLTHYLIANIKDRKLEQPVNMGRIWRIVPEGAKAPAVKLPADAAGLVAKLGDVNGWVRDTAQRVLVEKKDAAAVPALVELVKTGNAPAKIHALWTLEGFGSATPGAVNPLTAAVLRAAMGDEDAKVRATAVRLADRTLAPVVGKLAGDPSIDVRLAVAFAASPFPEAQPAVLAMARQSGADTLMRDALLSGLRGRELEILTELVTKSDKPAPAGMLGALAAAVLNERRSARVQQLLTFIAAQPANTPTQFALLEGASGRLLPKGAPKPKLLYLTGEAPELAALAAHADAKTKPLVADLDARIAWPNKPGVPPPPVVVPLTAAEQKIFETGKQVYTTLCTACHQPNGQGMDGLAPSLIESEWVLGKADVIPRIVLHGLTGPIQVNGQPWTLEMPPLGPALSDEQIAGVATYVRREWDHGASPISVEAVKQLRDEHKARTKSWTAEELGMGPKKPGKK